MTSVGPGAQTGADQTQTVSGLQVALLIVGNFTIKCHAVLEYGGEGGGVCQKQMLWLGFKCCCWSWKFYYIFRYFTAEPLEAGYNNI